MGFSKVFTSLAVAALACMAPSVSAQAKNLPWDGRGQDVTVATLDSKFMLHIFKQRQSGNGDPADYVTVDPKGRSSYNGDTGVINIAVDDKAIFGGQTTFRRSELVQQLNGASTTFFRASIKADKELVNKHKWQVFFPESHQWEVFVDMTLSPPEIQFLTESRVQWKTPFVTKTWYNFGIEVASSGITLYTSSGNAALAKSFSDNKATSGANQWELHFGLLTLSGSAAAPTMTGRDILSFNGVTVDTKASTSGGAGGADPAPAPAPDATPATPATRRPTTAPATDAPETPKPTSARTPRPTSAPVTAAPDAPSPAVTPAPKPASTPAPKPSSGTTPTKPNKCKAKRRRN